MAKGYSIPVGRSRHGKRLPHDEHDDDDSGSVTSPTDTPTITITVFSPDQPTVTSTVIASANADNSSIVVYPTQTTPGTRTGHDAVAAQPTAPTNSAVPSSSSGTPAGVVVGIVLAIILLLTAGGVFWFRRRSIAIRLKKRRWNKQQQNPPSFHFIEPKESVKVPPFPLTNSNMLQPHRGGDTAAPVNMMFASPGMDGLPYIPHPAPPRPPPAAGMYDAHTPATTSPSQVSNQVSPPPASPSLTASPLKQAETAKVRATFIPTLPDELTISTSEMVRIHTVYDDGWGLCSNARGEMGMVPLECLDRASQLPQKKPATREYRRSVRVSSLSATSRSPYGGNTLKLPYGGNQQ